MLYFDRLPSILISLVNNKRICVCVCLLRVKKLLWASESPKLEFHIDIELPPHSKHCLSVTKTNRLMLYQEILAVYCQDRTED